MATIARDAGLWSASYQNSNKMQMHCFEVRETSEIIGDDDLGAERLCFWSAYPPNNTFSMHAAHYREVQHALNGVHCAQLDVLCSCTMLSSFFVKTKGATGCTRHPSGVGGGRNCSTGTSRGCTLCINVLVGR
eukprot:2435991-Amphidinium_carterae.1